MIRSQKKRKSLMMNRTIEQSSERLAKKLACECDESNETWVEYAEAMTMQDSYNESFILIEEVFYENWTLCVFHISHILQHLGLFSVNNYDDGMKALNQAWARKYDYENFKLANLDLFQIYNEN